MLHGVAVAACRRDVVMVVVRQAMIDPVDAIEAPGIVCWSASAKGARPRHDALCVAFEDAPLYVLLGSNALIAAKFGDRGTYARHRCPRVGV